MPTLCLLDGIAIRLNTREHMPPHFHAFFGGDEISVNLDDDLTVRAGRISSAKQRLLMQWAAVHKEELMRNWDLAQNGLPHEPIAPTLTSEAN